jgi:hypothetical protein
MRYSTDRDTPAEPEYRPIGAFIDYYLANDVDGVVTLEIVGEDGSAIRSFSSEDSLAESGETVEPGMGAVPIPSDASTRVLPATSGMHRFVWNLRHVRPWGGDPQRDRLGGPLVAPGTYEARLTADGQTFTRMFRVLIDPRVEADGVTRSDLLAQEELNLRIRDLLGEARRSADRIEDLREELNGRIEAAEAADRDVGEAREVASELKDLHEALVSDPKVFYPQRMLIDQLEYLYGMTTSADQRPGADAFQRIETLDAELDELITRLNNIVRDRLPELNARLDTVG